MSQLLQQQLSRQQWPELCLLLPDHQRLLLLLRLLRRPRHQLRHRLRR